MVEITPERQIANVQEVLLRFVKRLGYWGVTMAQAKRAVKLSRSQAWGRAWRERCRWLSDAYAAVGALEQWRDLKARHAAGTLENIADDGGPF